MATDWTKKELNRPFREGDGSYAVVVPSNNVKNALDKGAAIVGFYYGRRVSDNVTELTNKQTQELLNDKTGFELEVDGDIGPKTKEAIKVFQKNNGLTVDGVAGRMTNAALQGIFITGPHISKRPGNNTRTYFVRVVSSDFEKLPSVDTPIQRNLTNGTFEGKLGVATQGAFEPENIVTWKNASQVIQDLKKAAYNLELLQEKIEESDYDYVGGEGYGILNLKKIGDRLLDLGDLLEEFFKNNKTGNDPITMQFWVGSWFTGFLRMYSGPAKKDLPEGQFPKWLWIGFDSNLGTNENIEGLGFINTPLFKDPRITTLLINIQKFNAEPGMTPPPGDPTCYRGTVDIEAAADEAKSSLTLQDLIDKYIFSTPSLDPTRAIEEALQTAEGSEKLAKKLANKPPFPKTAEEIAQEKTFFGNPTLKEVLRNKNKKSSSYAGDAVFQALPKDPSRIRSVDDAYAYVLNRIGLPQLAAEVLRCLRLDISVEDVLDATCNSMLQAIGQNPSQIEKAFQIMEREIDLFGIEGLEIKGQVLIEELKQTMFELSSQGVKDPFYQTLIEREIFSSPSGKRFLCEVIVGSLYQVGKAIKNFGEVELSSPYDPPETPQTPVIENCPLSFELPDTIAPLLSKGKKSLAQKFEEQLLQILDAVIVYPLREGLAALTDACQPQDVGVELPPDIVNDNLTNFVGPDANAEDLLMATAALLSPYELCSLLEGEPSGEVLFEVQALIKRDFQALAEKLDNFAKIEAFFETVGRIINIDFCDELAVQGPTPVPGGVCFEGPAPRELALADALANKGLNEAEIAQQLELNRQIKKDIIGDLARSILDPEVKFNFDINSQLGQDSSLLDKISNGVGGVFNGVETSFTVDSSTFVPSVANVFDKYNPIEPGEPVSGEIMLKDLLVSGENFTHLDPATKHRFIIPQQGLQFTEAVQDAAPASQELGGISNTFVLKRGDNGEYLFAIYNNESGTTEFFTSFSDDSFEIPNKYKIPANLQFNDIPEDIQVLGKLFSDRIQGDLKVSEIIDTSIGLQGQQINSLINSPTISYLLFDENSPSIAEMIYDETMLDLIKEPLGETSESELLEITTFEDVDAVQSPSIYDLTEIKRESAKVFVENLGKEDLRDEGEFKAFDSTMFESTTQAMVKLYIAENMMKAMFALSKFRVDESFSDILMSRYILNDINKESPELSGAIAKLAEEQEVTVEEKLLEMLNLAVEDETTQEGMDAIIRSALPAADPKTFIELLPTYDVATLKNAASAITDSLQYTREIPIEDDRFVMETYVKLDLKSPDKFQQQNMPSTAGNAQKQAYSLFSDVLYAPWDWAEVDDPITTAGGFGYKGKIPDQEAFSFQDLKEFLETAAAQADVSLTEELEATWVEETLPGWVGELEFKIVGWKGGANSSSGKLNLKNSNIQKNWYQSIGSSQWLVNPDRPDSYNAIIDTLPDDETEFDYTGYDNSHTLDITYSMLGIPGLTSFDSVAELNSQSTDVQYVIEEKEITVPKYFKKLFPGDDTSENFPSWDAYGYETFNVAVVKRLTRVSSQSAVAQAVETDWSQISAISDEKKRSLIVLDILKHQPYTDIFDNIKFGLRLSYVAKGEDPQSQFWNIITNPQTTDTQKKEDIKKNQKLLKAYGMEVDGSFEYVVPLLEVESQVAPSTSLINVLDQYPKSTYDSTAPLAKISFDNLIGLIQEAEDYQMIFEYLFPYKRILAINTIYNTYGFEKMFPDPCTYEAIFTPTKLLLSQLLKQSQGEEVEPASFTETFSDTLGTSAADCPQNLKSLSDFLRRKSEN